MDETRDRTRREGRTSLSERLRLAIDRLTDPETEVAEELTRHVLVDPSMGESAAPRPTSPNTQEA